MAEPFVAEIRFFAFKYAPLYWASCNGQTVPINQYAALFSLIGTAFGGNGTTNFGLPNLQGNVTVGQGQGTGLSAYQMGQTGGATTQTLTLQQMPAHNHALQSVPVATNSGSPAGTTLARNSTTPPYQSSGDGLQAMNAAAIPAVGGGGAHNNMMPYLVLNPCIALIGMYPEFS